MPDRRVGINRLQSKLYGGGLRTASFVTKVGNARRGGGRALPGASLDSGQEEDLVWFEQKSSRSKHLIAPKKPS